MKKITLLFSLLCLVCVNNSFAQITLDGTLDAGYTAGCAQVAPTQFGNSNISQTTWANGSEIDGIYYFSDGTNLYIMLTGNLETNYNKLEVFVDATAGGQNTLRDNNSGIDYGGLLRQTGLTFDSDFTADYWFSLTNGYDGVGYASYINFADLPTAGNGTDGFAGGPGSTHTAGNGVAFAINNINSAGVDAGSAAGASSVTTGMEIKIPLSVLPQMYFCIYLSLRGCNDRLHRQDRRHGKKVFRHFQRQQLSGVYFAEGANAGDIDGDGHINYEEFVRLMVTR